MARLIHLVWALELTVLWCLSAGSVDAQSDLRVSNGSPSGVLEKSKDEPSEFIGLDFFVTAIPSYVSGNPPPTTAGKCCITYTATIRLIGTFHQKERPSPDQGPQDVKEVIYEWKETEEDCTFGSHIITVSISPDKWAQLEANIKKIEQDKNEVMLGGLKGVKNPDTLTAEAIDGYRLVVTAVVTAVDCKGNTADSGGASWTITQKSPIHEVKE